MHITKLTAENADLFTEFADGVLLDNPLLMGVGCVDEEDEPIGATILDTDGNGLVIRSIMVEPSFRRKGAGTLMLEGAKEMARNAGLDIMDAFFTDEKSEPFFLASGFFVAREYPIFSLKREDLIGSKMLKKLFSIGKNCVALDSLTPAAREGLRKMLYEADYPYDPFFSNLDISHAYLKDGKIPTGCVLCTWHDEDNMLMIDLIANVEVDQPHHLAELVSALSMDIMKDMPKNTSIRFVNANDKMYSFVEKLLGGRKALEKRGNILHAMQAVFPE